MKKNDSLAVGVNVAADGAVDRYPDVFNLVSHADDLEPEDLFQVNLVPKTHWEDALSGLLAWLC